MKIRPTRVHLRPSLFPSLEPLEDRIAPALIVSGGADIGVSEQTGGNDNLTLTADAADFHFSDPGGIFAGPGATQVDTTHVDIPVGGFTGKISIDTGGGIDAVILGSALPTLAGLDVKTQAINPGIPFPSITTTGGSVSLTSSKLPLSINSTLADTGGGSISITAPGLSLDPGAKLTTTTGGVVLSVDSLTIDPAASIQTGGTNPVSFATFDIGITIDLGGKDGPKTLGISAAELANINTSAIAVQTENGPVVVSAPISRSSPTDFLILAGGPNNLTFKGPGMIDTGGGSASLVGRGIVSGSAATDVIASVLTLQVGQNGLGAKENPLSIEATLLDDTSFGDGVKQFITTANTVGLVKLNAAGAFVTLEGGTYVAMATQIMGEVLLKVNGTLDLNGHDQIISALKGSGIVTNSDGATPAQLDFSSDADASFSGALTGNLTILKDGPAGQRLTGVNTFIGDITINSGILQITSDSALGDPANALTINDGALSTIGTFTIPRSITAGAVGGTPTIDVSSGTLTLTGTITGNLQKMGDGNLLFGANFTGQAPVTANDIAVTIGDTTVALGGTGNVILTIVPDPINGGTRISQIELQDTHANSVLNIKGPTDGTTTTIDKIMSMDPTDAVGTIKLGASVILGDGISDAIPDLDIEGSIKKLLLNDVSANTRVNLGKGLAYLDTYKNHPQLNLRNVMGPGVIIDATGDGVTPAGMGGGGLGKIVVNQWSDPGIIQTTQGITSFQLKSGDCNVVFQLDPSHLGAATTANIGQMAIINGAWGSSGSVIEGTVGSFSAADFLAAADITAASMGKLTVKNGDYAGTTTLTDPSGKKMSTFSVNGNYLGLISSAEGIVNINVKGDFKGSLSAAFMGSITAYSLDGTGTNPGDRHQIAATNGSLGTLKTSLRGIQNFEIDVATIFNGFNVNWASAPNGAVGIDNVTVAAGQINHVDVTMKPATGAIVTGIQTSVFESASSIGEVTSKGTVTDTLFAGTTKIGNVLIKGDLTSSKLLAGVNLGGDGMLGGTADQFTPGGTIGNVTVTGMFATTTIAAGVDPGMDLTYGNGDTVGTSGLVAGPGKIGALVFGALSGTIGTTAGDPLSDPHSDAIEAASIKSLKVGTAKAVTNFMSTQYLDAAGDGESMSDVVVTLIS